MLACLVELQVQIIFVIVCYYLTVYMAQDFKMILIMA